MLSLALGLLVVCLAGNGSTPHATPRTFKVGQLVELVPSDSAPGQRFTLYLPTGFSPVRPAPIIYLMDPRGRARVPARLFQQAAERFGYVLISSHDTSSDGPVEPSLRAMQAMWDDSHAWFTIDPNRTYIAGFSGTARTASLLASTRSAFAGMIAVGAGLHPTVQPADVRLPYFAAVGEADYNFHEIETVEDALAALDAPHRVERFPGPHAWMPADVAMRAVEWLELRAMRAAARPVDAALVEGWMARDHAAAAARMLEGRVLDGARQYAAIARDFAGLGDTAPAQLAAARIAATPAAREQLRRRKAATRAWYDWADGRMKAIALAFPAGAPAPAASRDDLARLLDLAGLRRAADRNVPETALEARRRLNQLEVQLGFYLPHDAIAQKEFARAAYYLALAMEIDGTSPVSWYLKAQTSARLNLTQDALAALRRATDSGFRDLMLLEADASFAKLRATPGYAAIAAFLKAEGDTRESLTVDRPPVHVLLR